MRVFFPIPGIMFCLTTFVSAFLLVQITDTQKTTYQTRDIRITRLLYEPCRNQEVGKFIKDRYACDKFFYCGPNGLAISVECPNGMIFNSEKEICDFPWNFICIPEVEEADPIEETTVKEQETRTSVAPPTRLPSRDDRCPIDETRGLVFLPDHNECQRYYICYHGYPIPQQCIPELHWNPKLERCDFPENAGCLVVPPTPPTTSVTVVGVPMSCPFRGEQIFPHPEHCNYFIYCINGYATVQQCPFFHHYDVQSKSCMWQTVAKCFVSKEAPKPVKKQ